jgi:hypothetical protein
MTLCETLERISSDKYAETKSPGELAALIKPWLTNRTDRMVWPDDAPLLLRRIGDAPGWNRFDYEGWPTYRQLAAAHFVLRAAQSLTDIQDLEPSLELISLGRRICKETASNLRVSSGPASQNLQKP